MTHITDNHDALLDYIYDEGDPAERLQVARHLHECAACAVAVLEMQSVRGLLREWTPPDASLGFRIVSDAADPAQPVPLRPASPSFGRPTGRSINSTRWVQAIAAVFLVAFGMALSQVRVEYGNGALTLRARGVEAPAASTERAAEATAAPVIHRGTDVLLPPENYQQVSSTSSTSDRAAADDVLRRVKMLIDESESRQQRQLALRLNDVVRDFDVQRQADMQRVDQNLGQVEAQTGAEVARQRELWNSLVKVSQGGSK